MSGFANNQPGPQGPQGPAGGPQGAQGAAGPPGPQGPAGSTGPIGPQGAQGSAGPSGTAGAPGPQGASGSQGAQGDPGAAGTQGPQGATGSQGDPGATGPPGTQGAQGAQGNIGGAGPQGPAGPQGAAQIGPQGPQGLTGATGSMGELGPQGPQGAPGPQGPQGAPLVFDVRDYGATGDGTTDDTSAIEATVTAAAGAGGGVVFLPQGTYAVSTPITLANNISLVGAGKDVTVVSSSANEGLVLAGTGTGTSTYHDVRIAFMTVQSAKGPVIYFRNVTQVMVERCSWASSGAWPLEGLQLSFVDDFVIKNCTVQSFPGDSIIIEGCQHGRVEANYILNSEDDAIDVDYDITETQTVQSHHIVVANNVIEGTLTTATGGIRVEGSHHIDVTGNVCSASVTDASAQDVLIVVNSDGLVDVSVGTTHDVNVVGNTVTGAPFGITVDIVNAGNPNTPVSYNINVAGNNVSGCGNAYTGGGLAAGIMVHETASVVGNSVYNCGNPANLGNTAGIVAMGDSNAAPDGALFADNTIADCAVGFLTYGRNFVLSLLDNNFQACTQPIRVPFSSPFSQGTVIRGNVGLNPALQMNIVVPASGSSVAVTQETAAVIGTNNTGYCFDRTYYVTAAAGGCTVVVGPSQTITVPAGSCVPVFVPATATPTFTYATAPTAAAVGA